MLSASVSAFHLAGDVLRGHLTSTKNLLEDARHVTTAQEGKVREMSDAFLQEKGHRHRNERDVSLPRSPSSYLIVAEPGLVLGVLKDPFDPVSLRLHVGEAPDGDIVTGVAEHVRDLRRAVHLSPDQQSPPLRFFLMPIPDPDGLVKDLDAEQALGCASYFYPLPRLGWPCLHPLVDADPLRLGSGTARVLEIDDLILVDVGDKGLLESLER